MPCHELVRKPGGATLTSLSQFPNGHRIRGHRTILPLFKSIGAASNCRSVLLICRFTPTCPEVTRILSLGMDKQLSLMMRMKLRIHYLMCSFCERYMKQLKYIREVSREFPDKIGEVSDAALTADAKERMKAALRE